MLKTPSIEVIDRTSIELTSSHTETGLVEATSVPRRFRAVFAGDRSTSIEIEMVDGRPLVRAYSVATDSEDLAARPLRPALNGQLVPAAVRAACYTNIRRDMPAWLPSPPSTDGVGVIGPITLRMRLGDRTDEYGKAASQSAPRRRGRPPLTSEEQDLQAVAAAYQKVGSLRKVATNLNMSKSTVERRIHAAREHGLLD